MSEWIFLEDYYARETKIGNGKHYLIREEIYPSKVDGSGDYYIDFYDFDSGEPPETIVAKTLSQKELLEI